VCRAVRYSPDWIDICTGIQDSPMHVYSTGEMEFGFPVEPSSESEFITDLDSAGRAKITVEIGD
jgi:hypothetical protein